MRHRSALILLPLLLLGACDGDGPTDPVDPPASSWSWLKPLDIRPTALYETAEGRVWVGDAFGRALSYENGAWTTWNTGHEGRINSIWGVGGIAWAVGEEGVILGFDGIGWTVDWADYPAELHMVWGTDADNVWIVGQGGNVLRLENGAWRSQDTDFRNTLHAIAGSGPEDMLFGGADGLLAEFKGRVVKRVDADIEGTIRSLFIAPTGDRYAGADGVYLLKDDWDRLTRTPEVQGLAYLDGELYCHDGYSTLRLVNTGWNWVGGFNGYMLGGGGGRILTHGGGGEILAFDKETEVLRPRNGPKPVDIWGLSDEEIFLAYEDGAVRRWDGFAWHVEATGTDAALTELTALGDGTLVAGGEGVLAFREDGAWSTQALGWNVVDVWGPHRADVFAIGNDHAIRRWDGDAWRTMPRPEVDDLNALWGSGPDDVWAVGGSGTYCCGDVLHWNGAEWVEAYTENGSNLFSVWGWGTDLVLTCGGDGGEFHLSERGVWRAEYFYWDRSNYEVHGSGPDHAFAGGRDGSFWAWDGEHWRQEAPRFPDQLITDLWCAPDGRLYALVEPGGVLVYGP